MYEGRYRIIVNPNTANEKIYENKNMILRRAKTYAFGGPLWAKYPQNEKKIAFYVFNNYLDDNTLRNMYFSGEHSDCGALGVFIGIFDKLVDLSGDELTITSTTDVKTGPIDIHGICIEWFYEKDYGLYVTKYYYPIAVSRINPYLSLSDTDTYVVQYVLKLRW